jgi:ketol-acid reductoisomerase
MARILEEIRTGKFAEEWIAENRAGRPRYRELRAKGAELRQMMPFISAGKDRPQDVSGG